MARRPFLPTTRIASAPMRGVDQSGFKGAAKRRSGQGGDGESAATGADDDTEMDGRTFEDGDTEPCFEPAGPMKGETKAKSVKSENRPLYDSDCQENSEILNRIKGYSL